MLTGLTGAGAEVSRKKEFLSKDTETKRGLKKGARLFAEYLL